MRTITVGELRQNPAQMLADVEAGHIYRITRHNREIGRIIPPSGSPYIVPPKKSGPSHAAQLPRIELRSAASIDELIEDTKGEW